MKNLAKCLRKLNEVINIIRMWFWENVEKTWKTIFSMDFEREKFDGINKDYDNFLVSWGTSWSEFERLLKISWRYRGTSFILVLRCCFLIYWCTFSFEIFEIELFLKYFRISWEHQNLIWYKVLRTIILVFGNF